MGAGDRAVGKTVAVDLDEVLGAFILPLCDFHNEEYGTKLSVADFHSYSFAEVWGGTREEAVEKVHKFFESSHFEDIPLIPGAFAALKTLQDHGFRLVIVTSRQHILQEKTRAWVHRHYPGMFHKIAFGNHWGKEGKKISKKDLCAELGASILIDDNLTYAQEAASSGMKSILFDLEGGYGWSKDNGKIEDPEGVTRVRGWDEVVTLLLSHNGEENQE